MESTLLQAAVALIIANNDLLSSSRTVEKVKEIISTVAFTPISVVAVKNTVVAAMSGEKRLVRFLFDYLVKS